MMGEMIGRAILDERILDLALNRVFWKIIQNQRLSIYDLQYIDYDSFKFLLSLQNHYNKIEQIQNDNKLSLSQRKVQIDGLVYKGSKLEDLYISFILPGSELELCKNGNDVYLENSNILEYIDQYLYHYFQKNIEKCVQGFKKGFDNVIGIDKIRMFKVLDINKVRPMKQRIYMSENKKTVDGVRIRSVIIW